MLPRIAFIGTGGTIASIGSDPFDLLDYNASDERVDARTLLERSGLLGTIADIVPIDFRRMDSTAISSADWADLASLCRQLSRDSTFDGIVIGHGTASLEETAWVLSLVLEVKVPVVVTGSMRPLTGISSDAGANLAAAVRVATAKHEDGGNVFVVLNDEVHSPRAVTKNHTLRLNAFQSPWLGPIGTIDGSRVSLARQPRPKAAGFPQDLLRRLPRVDIAYSYAVNNLACSRARRLHDDNPSRYRVGQGSGLGRRSYSGTEASGHDASRASLDKCPDRATVGADARHKAMGIIAGNDLNPQKARILLALCLAREDTPQKIAEVFQSI